MAEPGDDKIRAKWWELYNDPQLNALEEQVAISNQTIAAAEANFRTRGHLVVSGAIRSFSNDRSCPQLRELTHFRNRPLIPSTGHTTLNTFSDASGFLVHSRFLAQNQEYPGGQSDSAQASAADVATALLSTQAELATLYLELRAVDMQRKHFDRYSRELSPGARPYNDSL